MNSFIANKNSGFQIQKRVSDMVVSKKRSQGPINEYHTQNNLNVKAYQLYEIEDIALDTTAVRPQESQKSQRASSVHTKRDLQSQIIEAQ
jgi:hypothetical protein